MASYQDLVAQREALQKQQAELDKQIADALNAERTGVLNQIRSLMAEHGITIADLTSKSSRSAGSTKSSSSTAGKKVAPKYRNPSTGDTWSGRGLQPKWLKAAIAEGKKLEDFGV